LRRDQSKKRENYTKSQKLKQLGEERDLLLSDESANTLRKSQRKGRGGGSDGRSRRLLDFDKGYSARRQDIARGIRGEKYVGRHRW